MNLTPVPTAAGPLFCDVDHCKIKHFEKAIVSRKNTFVFGDFSELAIKSIDSVGCVN
jgi:hypothetical protein